MAQQQRTRGGTARNRYVPALTSNGMRVVNAQRWHPSSHTSLRLCLTIYFWYTDGSCWPIGVSVLYASAGDFAQAIETPKNASFSVTLTSPRLCAADVIWYCMVEKHPNLKQSICICPGGTETWFPSVPEHVWQPVFWSIALLSAFLLASAEAEKKNHNDLLACPWKQKGNLLLWRQATRPHWFNEANSPD